jgi:hypothetical protein
VRSAYLPYLSYLSYPTYLTQAPRFGFTS